MFACPSAIQCQVNNTNASQKDVNGVNWLSWIWLGGDAHTSKRTAAHNVTTGTWPGRLGRAPAICSQILVLKNGILKRLRAICQEWMCLTWTKSSVLYVCQSALSIRIDVGSHIRSWTSRDFIKDKWRKSYTTRHTYPAEPGDLVIERKNPLKNKR